jgi:hypothetical protein
MARMAAVSSKSRISSLSETRFIPAGGVFASAARGPFCGASARHAGSGVGQVGPQHGQTQRQSRDAAAKTRAPPQGRRRARDET